MTEFKLIYTVTYSCDESGDTTVPLNYHSYQETAMFKDKETAMDFYSQCIGEKILEKFKYHMMTYVKRL